MLLREFHDLTPYSGELIGNSCVRAGARRIKNSLCGIQRGAQRRWPPAKCVHDRSQRRECVYASLPARSGDHAPYRAALEIRPLVLSQILQQVERVFHQARDTSVVAWARDDQSIRFSHHFDELTLLLIPLAILRSKVRKVGEKGSAEQERPRTSLLRRQQR